MRRIEKLGAVAFNIVRTAIIARRRLGRRAIPWRGCCARRARSNASPKQSRLTPPSTYCATKRFVSSRSTGPVKPKAR